MIDGDVAVVVDAVRAVVLLGGIGRREAAGILGEVGQAVAVVVEAVAADERRQMRDPPLLISGRIHAASHDR
jgi:hypothetical protein